jgi:hypothetical protein
MATSKDDKVKAGKATAKGEAGAAPEAETASTVIVESATAGAPFNPDEHMMSIKGKKYLPAAWRLVWMRSDHPDWRIITKPVEINFEKQFGVFHAEIQDGQGNTLATGHKMESVKDFGDWLEKSETGAIARALAAAGYGTQFAPEFEEGNRITDSPQAPNRPLPESVSDDNPFT